MPRGKKNSATSAVSKTANKPVEPIKETAAEPEKKSVKPTAEKKKATAPKKAAATKSSAKARTTKKTSTSADVKAENVSVTGTKKAAPKTAAKSSFKTKKDTVAKPKAAAKKPVAKTEKKTVATAPKRTVKKSAKGKSDEVVIQSGNKDYTLSEITQICKDAYRGGTRKQIKSIKVYVKAEGNKLKAYYVVNDSMNGSVDL